MRNAATIIMPIIIHDFFEELFFIALFIASLLLL